MEHYISIELSNYDGVIQSYIFRTSLDENKLFDVNDTNPYNNATDIFTPEFCEWLNKHTNIIKNIIDYMPTVTVEYGEFSEFKEVKF